MTKEHITELKYSGSGAISALINAQRAVKNLGKLNGQPDARMAMIFGFGLSKNLLTAVIPMVMSITLQQLQGV